MTSTSNIIMIAGFALLGLGKISPRAAKVSKAGLKSFVTAKALLSTGLPYTESRLLYEHGIPLATKRIEQTTDALYRKAIPESYRGKILPAGIKSAGNALMSLSGAHCEVPEILFSHYIPKFFKDFLRTSAKLLGKHLPGSKHPTSPIKNLSKPAIPENLMRDSESALKKK